MKYINKLISKLKPHNSDWDLNPLFLIEITLLASGFAEVQVLYVSAQKNSTRGEVIGKK